MQHLCPCHTAHEHESWTAHIHEVEHVYIIDLKSPVIRDHLHYACVLQETESRKMGCKNRNGASTMTQKEQFYLTFIGQATELAVKILYGLPWTINCTLASDSKKHFKENDLWNLGIRSSRWYQECADNGDLWEESPTILRQNDADDRFISVAPLQTRAQAARFHNFRYVVIRGWGRADDLRQRVRPQDPGNRGLPCYPVPIRLFYPIQTLQQGIVAPEDVQVPPQRLNCEFSLTSTPDILYTHVSIH